MSGTSRTAQEWVRDEQLVYVWEEDAYFNPEDTFDDEDDRAFAREHGAVQCTLFRPCPEHGVRCPHAVILASLSGIVESLDTAERDDYRRVVEEELAREAQPAQDA